MNGWGRDWRSKSRKRWRQSPPETLYIQLHTHANAHTSSIFIRSRAHKHARLGKNQWQCDEKCKPGTKPTLIAVQHAGAQPKSNGIISIHSQNRAKTSWCMNTHTHKQMYMLDDLCFGCMINLKACRHIRHIFSVIWVLALLVRTWVRLTSEFGLFGWCERCLPTVPAPTNRTWFRLKSVVWCEHNCGSELLLMTSYLIKMCLCFTHFPDGHDRHTAGRELYVSFLFTLRQT